MRRLTSKKDEEKKQKRNNLILGIILIVVMLFSTLGYGFLGRPSEESTSDSNKITYNGYEFLAQNGFWILNYQGIDFVFKYNPKEVTSIYSIINNLDSYFQKPLYIYSEDISSETEIYVNLNNVVLRIQKACIEGTVCLDENLPIKTCADNFIVIKEGNSTGITQQDNCVFIEGKSENLLKLTDEFLFKILEIE